VSEGLKGERGREGERREKTTGRFVSCARSVAARMEDLLVCSIAVARLKRTS